jgi:hypothetical protein
LVAQRELHTVVGEPVCIENLPDDLQRPREFVLDLILRAEHVRVVLGQTTHPREPCELPALLVAVQRRELRVPEREIAVRVGPGIVERHVAGAVHGLQPVTRLAVDHGWEHRLPVVLQMSRLREQGLVDQVPGPHVLVAVARLDLAHVVFHEVPHHLPLGQEERDAGSCIGREREELEVLADLAVVPRPRLIEAPEVSLQLLLRRPCRTIDAG